MESDLSVRLMSILEEWPEWGVFSARPELEKIQRIEGGLTNASYLLSDSKRSIILRLNGDAKKLEIDRRAELKIHLCMAELGLAPKIIYCDVNKHYLIREYVAGSQLDCKQAADCLPDVAEKLRLTHQTPILKNEIPTVSLKRKALHYWGETAPVQKQGEAETLFNSLLVELFDGREATAIQSLCHLDPNLANWIQTENGLQLLDWEYAALGNPCWDLAVFSIDAELAKAEELMLLKLYGWRDEQGYFLAKKQMRFISALWFAAQGISNEEQLMKSLQEIKKTSN